MKLYLAHRFLRLQTQLVQNGQQGWGEPGLSKLATLYSRLPRIWFWPEVEVMPLECLSCGQSGKLAIWLKEAKSGSSAE